MPSLADFVRDYWAPDREQVLAQMQAQPSPGGYTSPGQEVPGAQVPADDWFAQQGAPGGGAAGPDPGNHIMPDGSSWLIGIDQAHSRQVSPPGSFDPRSGTGINNPPRPMPSAPTLTTPGGPVPGAGPAAPTGGGMTDAQAQQFFDQLFPGETVTPEQIEAARPQLEATGFQLNPNAAGRITDLRLPSGNYVDPIYGVGAGINRKQWIVEAPGAGGGGAPGQIGAGLIESPGFQFRLGEGLKALERSAAAKGTLLTGGTLKGLNRFAQDYASNEYANRVNQLRDVAQLGYGAVGQQAGLGSGYGLQAGNLLGQQAQGVGNLLTEQGNAQAAGTVGAANAWQQGLGGVSNALQSYYLSRLFGSPATTQPGTAGPYPTNAVTPLAPGNPSLNPPFLGWAG